MISSGTSEGIVYAHILSFKFSSDMFVYTEPREFWPKSFEYGRVITYLYLVDEIVDWLDATCSGEWSMPCHPSNASSSDLAMSFEHAEDLLLFQIRWLS